jgi:uncharacterized protein
VFVVGGNVIYSASDLATAARCEYGLLRAFDFKLGRGPAPVVDDDEMLRRTAELGDAHEGRRLARFRREHRDGVVGIGRPAFTEPGLRAAVAATQQALDAKAPVVYQAAMFDGRFVGFADFLVRVGDRYQVWDTKLARSAKVTALLQLAAYADALATAGVPVAPEVLLILGDDTTLAYPIDELRPVYRRQRAALQSLLDEHLAGGEAVDWADQRVRACLRCADCQVKLQETDDLLLVAGMRVSQRAKLIDAGLTTVLGLAGHVGAVKDLPARTVASLTAQAALQMRERDTGRPQFEVVDPAVLGALPEPDDGDLFFDFEGDPLWTANGVDWGLEYLFGILEAGPACRFRPLWAHDRAGERKALSDFLGFVRRRRARHPKMHIYHYAPYERTALLRLAGRYGVGEDEIDNLLRAGVFVDLYPLVRKSIRVGAKSYGLKALEPLFTTRREGEVTTATDSITEYAHYCRLRDANEASQAAEVLNSIAEYNRFDCHSTKQLRDWLLIRAFENGVTHLTKPAAPAIDEAEADTVGRALAEFAGDSATAARSAEQTAVALIGAARGYHRREDKPFWWAHFDRLASPVDEWAETSGVYLVDSPADVTMERDWHLPPRAQKPQRHVRLRGQLPGGDLRNDVFAVYDPPAPVALVDGDPDRRGAGAATVIETVQRDGIPVEVVIRERARDGGEFDQLPIALTPGAPISTATLRDAIDALAAEVADSITGSSPPKLPRSAALDILARRPPRTRSGEPLPHAGKYIEDITAALLDLDSSYLAVHGPPGTGKTFTAAHVIATLVNTRHWRIGVVAQSHAVVENVLHQVVGAGVDPQRVAKKRQPDAQRPATWQQIADNSYAAFLAAAADGCVLGGTAWDFANARRVPTGSLDLLVLDEAGQFCLANTIAVAGAARNLLLLGDPQQLPQVTTGNHPEPVDCSALGWLVEGSATLPAERGYFLARSHRMHPAVCAPVSRLSYQGRLRSHDQAGRRDLLGQRPGVHTLLVEHHGNTTDSPQEAAAIVTAIAALLGTPWRTEDGTRPLTASDVLVVAPYNAQVLRLRMGLQAAGLDDVAAGTVDKFQGRQAAVVFVSMTSSSVEDVPRGISFLLNRNRLNVAVSRAEFAAIIVRSPLLTAYLPGSPEALTDLGRFLTLAGCDTPAP